MGEVVAAERPDRGVQCGVGEGCADRAGGAELVPGEGEVVGLPGQGQEVEPEVGEPGAQT